MSFREWLHDHLVADDAIGEDTEAEELSVDMLLMETDVEEADIENYREQFREHCSNMGVEPIWDVE